MCIDMTESLVAVLLSPPSLLPQIPQSPSYLIPVVHISLEDLQVHHLALLQVAHHWGHHLGRDHCHLHLHLP